MRPSPLDGVCMDGDARPKRGGCQRRSYASLRSSQERRHTRLIQNQRRALCSALRASHNLLADLQRSRAPTGWRGCAHGKRRIKRGPGSTTASTPNCSFSEASSVLASFPGDRICSLALDATAEAAHDGIREGECLFCGSSVREPSGRDTGHNRAWLDHEDFFSLAFAAGFKPEDAGWMDAFDEMCADEGCDSQSGVRADVFVRLAMNELLRRCRATSESMQEMMRLLHLPTPPREPRSPMPAAADRFAAFPQHLPSVSEKQQTLLDLSEHLASVPEEQPLLDLSEPLASLLAFWPEREEEQPLLDLPEETNVVSRAAEVEDWLWSASQVAGQTSAAESSHSAQPGAADCPASSSHDTCQTGSADCLAASSDASQPGAVDCPASSSHTPNQASAADCPASPGDFLSQAVVADCPPSSHAISQTDAGDGPASSSHVASQASATSPATSSSRVADEASAADGPSSASHGASEVSAADCAASSSQVARKARAADSSAASSQVARKASAADSPAASSQAASRASSALPAEAKSSAAAAKQDAVGELAPERDAKVADPSDADVPNEAEEGKELSAEVGSVGTSASDEVEESARRRTTRGSRRSPQEEMVLAQLYKFKVSAAKKAALAERAGGKPRSGNDTESEPPSFDPLQGLLQRPASSSGQARRGVDWQCVLRDIL